MSDLISYLFAIFVLNPLQADLSERLQGVAAADIVQAGRSCIAAEGPRLLQQAQDNWAWAASHSIGVSFGMIDPVTLLSTDNENCLRISQFLRQDSSEAEG
ncbi:MAG: hypothetical protein EOO82_00965 [Oxalobacteraceae bacterium]|nr:MAG: hypothetical protein EOO82_00965 [Oxalobacteraceae bacterium]